jgi:hypothetical protein
VSLSTARGSEDAPRRAARLSTETAVDVGRLDRPCSYELRHLSADCPSPDTVVLVFTVASQNRLGTQPKEPWGPEDGQFALRPAEPGPNN